MKSHVSTLTDLANCILMDASAKCAARHSSRDLLTLKSRVENEGLSFFTITLPSLGKDFERSLDQGWIAPTFFRSFKKNGKAPAFLRGFFELIFDENGGLLDDPNIAAIEGVRQIAYSFKKLGVPCTAKRNAAAISKFKEEEQVFEFPLDSRDISDFDTISRLVWDPILRSIDPMDCSPRHGPGSTAEKLMGNQKFKCSRWHERLESTFPMFHNYFPNENAYDSKEFKELTLVCRDDEQPVRVITVPKTLKSPRIIAIEPVCMQYTQQGLARCLIKTIEGHRLTTGHINFTDQNVNRSLAMRASSTKGHATLDLSSASDRVPYSLASHMFHSNPDLWAAIDACRSTRAQIPSGEVITLKKFASMGSALCFPVESMYFYTICVVALLRKQNLPLDMHSVQKVAKHIYVYGDDLIVPTHSAAVVAETLQKYYCKVNTDKSFWTGKFRESCGMDAFNGEDVTPSYIRTLPPVDKRKASPLISWVKASNLFYNRGYWRTAEYLKSAVEKVLGALPILDPRSGGLGLVSFQHLVTIHGWDRGLHRPKVKAWCAAPVYRKDRLDGYHALLKCLLKLEGSYELQTSITLRNSYEVGIPQVESKSHLEETARFGAVTLKRRWICPYSVGH